MSGSWARIPPTVAPPSLSQLTRGLGAIGWPRGYAGTLEREIQALFPEAHVGTFATGRGALAAAIRIAMARTGRRTVVVPGFTSFSVAGAVASVRATPRICDVDPGTLDFDRADLRRCVDGSVAAVIVGNLFGYPSRTDDLDWVTAGGALLVDDAAQALGARADGAAVGGRGHLGVLSFGRGKCVTTGDGGALLVHDAELLGDVPVAGGPNGRGVRTWMMACAVRLAARPLLFGLMSRLPGADIGASHYESAFDEGAAPASVDGLAAGLGASVARQIHVRTRVAWRWFAALEGTAGAVTIGAAPGSEPAYLRVAVLATDAGSRARTVAALADCGMPYGQSYPTTLARIPAFADLCDMPAAIPGAEALAARVVALPCHEGVSDDAIARGATAFQAQRG